MKERLEDYIYQNSILFPEKVAIVAQGKETTYCELFSLIQIKAEELKAESWKAGDVYVVRSSQTLEYLVLYFALHSLDVIVCPLEKGISDERFAKIKEEVSHFDPASVPTDSTFSDILYTTGTTGASKGVLVTRKAILSNGENLIESQGFTKDLVFVITGPINHSGNWSKVFPTMMVGATLYILEGMKDLNAFFDALNYSESKSACFLVPASIRMLILFSKKQLQKLQDKIEFAETGGAPISVADMKGLSELLPHSRLYNTYASSETGMICTYNFNDGLYKDSCCGSPMKHASFKIVNGKIVCRNGGQMSCYINSPELTNEVLKDGFIFTNDLGHVDSEGMLRIEGRDGDVINVGGLKVSPIEVENCVQELSEIEDCICLPKPHPVMGNVVRLLVVVKEGFDFDKRSIASYLASKLENYKVPQSIELVEKINRTYNGKLDRKSYKN